MTADRQLYFALPPVGRPPVPPLTYSVRPSRRAKHVNIEVTHDGSVVVVVPRWFKRANVPNVIEENRRWIERARRQMMESAPPPEPVGGLPVRVELRAVAETWPVVYQSTPSRSAAAREHRDGRLVVSGAATNRPACRAALQRWLSRKAHRLLVPWLRMISDTRELPVGRILVKNQRTRWASCTSQKTISLNQNLLFLPPRLVRYIFLHELCHTRHVNHSKRFWAVVRLHEPDYKALEKQLDRANRYVPRWSRRD
jgi:hypothetical protein